MNIRTSLRWLYSVLAMLGLVAAMLAIVGYYSWGSVGWYFHAILGLAGTENTADYRLRRGEEALRRGDTELAGLIADHLEVDGYKDHALLLRGERIFEQARPYADAENIELAAPLLVKTLLELNKIRDQGKLRLDAAVIIGKCYVYMRQPIEAEHALRFVLSERPDDVEAHRGLFALYYDQGALMRTVQHAHKVAELDPRDGRPNRLIGLIYKDIEQYPEAIASYREALKRNLTDRVANEVRRELLECLVRQHEYKQAEELLPEIAAYGEEAAVVEALRAETLMGLGRTSEAATVLDQAREIYSENNDLLRLRAKIYLETDAAKDAVELLERALRLDRADVKSRYLLVGAYKALGRTKEAEEQQRLHDQTQKDLEELHRLSRQANEGDPFDARVRYKLADLCEKLGKVELSQIWRRAAESCPSLPTSDPKK